MSACNARGTLRRGLEREQLPDATQMPVEPHGAHSCRSPRALLCRQTTGAASNRALH
jgi:hypothetical protein